ncbi:MAG: hypothetical protein SWZ49_12635 [Cyanobacteriota bacterium]|nr:hypothetical protein [Cyanobacteriota bacterium]
MSEPFYEPPNQEEQEAEYRQQQCEAGLEQFKSEAIKLQRLVDEFVNQEVFGSSFSADDADFALGEVEDVVNELRRTLDSFLFTEEDEEEE